MFLSEWWSVCKEFIVVGLFRWMPFNSLVLRLIVEREKKRLVHLVRVIGSSRIFYQMA